MEVFFLKFSREYSAKGRGTIRKRHEIWFQGIKVYSWYSKPEYKKMQILELQESPENRLINCIIVLHHSSSRLDPPIQPQTREIRIKNVFFMSVYLAWFSGIVLFIMYRLKSDDLDTMEKEAEARLKINYIN